MILRVLYTTLDYPKDLRKLFERVLDQLRWSKRSILLHTIQWTNITTVCFLLIYAIGTLALYTITPYRTRPAHSDLQADYGEWPVVFVARVDPEIIEEIKRDNPQNPEVFLSPEEMDPYEDPFIIINDRPRSEEPPILDTPQPTLVASEPTNTRSPDRSPTSTPIVTDSPSPTPTTLPTISPTNTPVPTQPPTRTPVPPIPTSLPPPTDQPLVTICHKPGEHQKTLSVPESEVAGHLGHGDYIGECTNP